MNLFKVIKSKRGFTLVEVLVALVILSIGLLGVAGMQIRGMQGNHNSFLRSQALQYAYEMLDMMRANRTSAVAGNYNIALADAVPNPANTVAQQDIVEWRQGITGVVGTGNMASGLSGGQGSVAVAGANPATVTVTITWNEGRFVAADVLPQVVVETKL